MEREKGDGYDSISIEEFGLGFVLGEVVQNPSVLLAVVVVQSLENQRYDLFVGKDFSVFEVCQDV